MPNLIGGILLGYIWQILLNGVLANLQRPLLALDANFRSAPEVVRGELASGGKWKPGELNRFEHFAMKYLLPLCLTRPHFVAYCAAEDGNLSMWLEKKLFRPYLAAWTIRDQKLMDRVQKEYDYPIFELFTPKEKQ